MPYALAAPPRRLSSRAFFAMQFLSDSGYEQLSLAESCVNFFGFGLQFSRKCSKPDATRPAWAMYHSTVEESS
jgi:hypothetical protein